MGEKRSSDLNMAQSKEFAQRKLKKNLCFKVFAFINLET